MRTEQQKTTDSQIAELLNRLEFALPEHFNSDNRAFWVLRLISVTDKVPLHLDAMIKAVRAGDRNLSDVTHDLGGIQKHWDGERFNDCFCPRFMVQQGG